MIDRKKVEIRIAMPYISVIPLDESDKWDKIVKSFSDFDVYYLSDYTKAFSVHGDGNPLLFYYEDENIKAMNAVMKRDISNDTRFIGKIPPNAYYDITTPYGYGGFLIEGRVTEESLNTLGYQYNSLCKKEGIVSEFVRFHPVLNNRKFVENFYDVLPLGKTIVMNLESQEQIWSDLTVKNRNVIRKAIKNGVEIFWGRSAELYKEFIGLYNSTMDKDHAIDYYYFTEDFYKSILHDLKYNSMMFYGVYDNKIISMSIIMFANQQMHYHLSASDREYQYLAPTNLLLYEAACWGLENGFKTFHLGGGLDSKEDSLYKFKKAFNRYSDYTFAIGKRIFEQEKYNQLLLIRESELSNDKEINYFPKYRA